MSGSAENTGVKGISEENEVMSLHFTKMNG
jgi:hypothetical protein